ncbi:MAG: DUF2235 domain-containing protein [Planctomycetota bacterium]
MLLVVVGLTTSAAAADLVLLFDGTGNNEIRADRRPAATPKILKPLAGLKPAEIPLSTERVDDMAFAADAGRGRVLDEGATNIARLFVLLARDAGQRVLYVRGIGTDAKPNLDGSLGLGADERVEEGRRFVARHWQPGDEVCAFGFSRGAATARLFVRALCRDGVAVGDTARFPPVRFVGLFDTVAAFGLPLPKLTPGGGKKPHPGYRDFFRDLAIPKAVSRAVHLVALDEGRSVFLPTLISDRPVNDGRRREIWFGGDHADIGGGHTDDRESLRPFRRRQVTLRFMLRQRHGLRLVEDWDRHPDVFVDRRDDPVLGTRHRTGGGPVELDVQKARAERTPPFIGYDPRGPAATALGVLYASGS